MLYLYIIYVVEESRIYNIYVYVCIYIIYNIYIIIYNYNISICYIRC